MNQATKATLFYYLLGLALFCFPLAILTFSPGFTGVKPIKTLIPEKLPVKQDKKDAVELRLDNLEQRVKFLEDLPHG